MRPTQRPRLPADSTLPRNARLVAFPNAYQQDDFIWVWREYLKWSRAVLISGLSSALTVGSIDVLNPNPWRVRRRHPSRKLAPRLHFIWGRSLKDAPPLRRRCHQTVWICCAPTLNKRRQDGTGTYEDAPHFVERRLTPQFSGRALLCEARRERIIKWRARAVAATPCHGPLQLLVIRQAAQSNFRRFFSAAHSRRYRLIRF